MSTSFNHTIVYAKDRDRSAAFFTDLFGLPDAVPTGVFLSVRLDNDVTLDFDGPLDEVQSQHYAFHVSEDQFDAVYGRIVERGLEHWADPRRSVRGEVNTHNGGRGVYFEDPSGHFMEILTRP
ncbi:VOC family protein [Rhodococcus tukisamuensis]|uniref:Catechol 2,3-dioxygenase n=1 Tax=Rhodococcus tukisamuensis TaxID=168276 RepID=A0A1G6S4W6_9NOCA|nr:VOC family protein [Rhodococcus tukisamuensis]SDD11879.1 Catechol 2,3-dioxygenase [Rhodococcus tukisamuensis]